MSESPNKFLRFWQELKRRKVFSVVTTYAATSYIIIEVVNNLIGPLHLPDWLATLVVILLIIGLPVTVIAAWIFDFTPQGIKKTESLEELENKAIAVKPVKRKLRASYILNAVLIIAVMVLAYPKIFKRNTLERLRSSGERISVSVMPFRNMTNDTIWNVWQDGIQDILISSLSNSPEELTVKQVESINNLIQSRGLTNYASITPTIAGKISQKVDANVFIYGNIKQAGSTLRLYAQLIDSKTEEVFKSFQIESAAKEENIFQVIDSLSVMVKDFLLITKLAKDSPISQLQDIPNTSPEAYRYFISGKIAYSKRDYPIAIKLFLQALAADSNLYEASYRIPYAYLNQGLYEQAKKWCLKNYEKRDHMPMQDKIYADGVYAACFETPNEVIRYLRQLQEFDDQNPILYYNTGNAYRNLEQNEKAIPEYEKSLEIYNKWNLKPSWAPNYTGLGLAYHKTGQFKKEKRLFKIAEQDFPDDVSIIYRQAVLALSDGKSKDANEYLEKYKSIRKDQAASEATIMTNMANIYWQGEILDKAEGYFRVALLLEAEAPVRMNNLAWFLIDTDRNINEGLQLVDKALTMNPDNYNYTDCKGWGLFKMGKYQEALVVLQKSWDLRMKNAIYSHTPFLHLEAAKKAVANQTNN